jgi:hypothetical protein
VVFAHDTECALQAAVTLVNSASEPDTLTMVAELNRFWDDHSYTGRHDRTREELDAVRALRPRLRELLTAERDDAATLVNRMLSEAQAVPQLIRHDPLDWVDERLNVQALAGPPRPPCQLMTRSISGRMASLRR